MPVVLVARRNLLEVIFDVAAPSKGEASESV